LARGRVESIESLEQRQRFFGRGAVLDGGRQQPARRRGFAALEGRRARLDELLGFPLAFGNRAAGALDVGTCARVPAIEEEGAGPDVDSQLVLSRKVVIEAVEKQFFDAGFAVALRLLRGRVGW
jgi:hypothetical protein